MARGPNSVLLHRSYAGSACCSPTRAALLTGRAPQRSCIDSAGGCGQQPAYKCKAKHQLPWNQYTVASAAKQSPHGYDTFFMGKWHLGDFWDMKGTGPKPMSPPPYSHPGLYGFDNWYATKASASSSMLNCGCFHPAHQCATGKGKLVNKALKCTNYWYEDKSISKYPTGATNITEKQQGDDNEFIVDKFESWLRDKGRYQKKPWLALLWVHTVHVPHPAMPEWYAQAPFPSKNGDYQGTLSQMDAQIGRLRSLLKELDVSDNTLVWYTTDNGPHGKNKDTSTSVGGYGQDGKYFNGLRQCKGSIFEGGTRVPAIIEWPAVIKKHQETFTVTGVFDMLPTILDIIGESRPANYSSWELDGMSIFPWLRDGFPARRPKALGLIQHNGASGKNSSQARHDGDMKLVFNPGAGQCSWTKDGIFNSKVASEAWFLFNLTSDPTESVDVKGKLPSVFNQMKQDHMKWLDSVYRSRSAESQCSADTAAARANFDAGLKTAADGVTVEPYTLDQLVDSGSIWPIPDEWFSDEHLPEQDVVV